MAPLCTTACGPGAGVWWPQRRCAQVFATCGSERKRRYLLDRFPRLRADHIGDSRSTSFEAMVKHLARARSVCTQCVAEPV